MTLRLMLTHMLTNSVRLTIANLLVSGVALAGEEELPPPGFKASLICFNGEDGSRSSCRVAMAKMERGFERVKGKLSCGFKGAVSEITWSYRGRRSGKDLYHFARKFPLNSKDAKITEVDIAFDGTRAVLFKDQSQCIVIQPEPVDD